MAPRKINLRRAGEAIEKPWSPAIAGDINESQVKIARFEGDFDWHSHAGEDEGFLILKGNIVIDFRDESVELGEGDFLVVPRGVEHRPRSADGDNVVLMFEPRTTVNTGDTVTRRTVADLPRL